MKKLDLIKVLAAIVLTTTMVFSEAAFQKGDNALDIKLILGWEDGIGAALVWDHGAINDMFSFGGGFDFSKKKSRVYLFDTGLRYIYLTPAFRFAFHIFGIPEIAKKSEGKSKHDLYAGVRTGVKICLLRYERDYYLYDNLNTTSAKFMFDPIVGYRFYFSEKVSLVAETGFYNFNAGIGFKF